MSNFRIGQEIVCEQEDTDQNGIVKNEIYTVLAIRASLCRCKNVIIDVGVEREQDPIWAGKITCKLCGCIADWGYIRWYGEYRFVPLQTASEESDMEQSIKEALEKTLFV